MPYRARKPGVAWKALKRDLTELHRMGGPGRWDWDAADTPRTLESRAAATQARADCLNGAIRKLQRGEIDINKVPFGLEPGYSVRTCGVIIVAQIHNDTLGLIDVLETPDESV